jgi:hypothetical protein
LFDRVTQVHIPQRRRVQTFDARYLRLNHKILL